LTVKLRSKRGTLSTRVKKAIFSVFRLPEIKNKAKANEISLWKSLPTVSAAYNNLFKKVNNDENSPTYMKQIIEKVWLKTEASDLHTSGNFFRRISPEYYAIFKNFCTFFYIFLTSLIIYETWSDFSLRYF
jgi:hypothetical protein